MKSNSRQRKGEIVHGRNKNDEMHMNGTTSRSDWPSKMRNGRVSAPCMQKITIFQPEHENARDSSWSVYDRTPEIHIIEALNYKDVWKRTIILLEKQSRITYVIVMFNG